MKVRTAIRVGIGVTLVVLIAPLVASSMGRSSLRGWSESRQHEIEAYEVRANAPRPTLAPVESDENAAALYRLVFGVANAGLSPADQERLVRDAQDLAALDADFSEKCPDVEPVIRGARRSRVSWGLNFSMSVADQEPQGMVQPARLIAYCLVREGARRAHSLDWTGALDPYIAGLRLSADLRLTGLLGNLNGVNIARLDIVGLGRLITTSSSIPSQTLADLGRELKTFEPYLTSFGEATTVERLETLAGVRVESERAALRLRESFGPIVPAEMIIAGRLLRAEDFLRRTEVLTTQLDPAERSRLEQELAKEATSHRSALIRIGGVPRWSALRNRLDELRQDCQTLQAAVTLEQWYLQHGDYPIELSTILSHERLPGPKYVRQAGGKAYRLESVRGAEGAQHTGLVIERRPR